MISNPDITVNAYAKINLFLEVNEKQSDGYHLLQSVMQTVTLCDTIGISKTEDSVSLFCEGCDREIKDNIIIKAAKMFFNTAYIKGGTDIHLTKRIPIESGLGGGSADAAAVLLALNKLYGEPLSETELYKTAKKLGADVPFCMKKGLCSAFGIGEILEDIGRLPDCFILISVGNCTVPTKKAFEAIDLETERKTVDMSNMIAAIDNKELNKISSSLYNCFDILKLSDPTIKKIMQDHGALGESLSGSGPSVFGIFDDENKAISASNELTKSGYKAFVCRPYYRSE